MQYAMTLPIVHAQTAVAGPPELIGAPNVRQALSPKHREWRWHMRRWTISRNVVGVPVRFVIQSSFIEKLKTYGCIANANK